MEASAYLTFMRHIAHEAGLHMHGAFPSPACVLRYEGTVLFWWSRKLTYRTQVAILMCVCSRTRANKPMPHVSASSCVRRQSREKLFIRDPNWRVKKILVSTCGSDTRLTSKKLPSMATPSSNMATVFCGTLLFTKKMSAADFSIFTIREFHLEVEKTLSI